MYSTTHTPTQLGVQLLVFSPWLLYFLLCIILTFSYCNDHRTTYFDKPASWRPASRKKVPHLLHWYWVCFAMTAACHIDNFFQQKSWWPWGKNLLEVTLGSGSMLLTVPICSDNAHEYPGRFQLSPWRLWQLCGKLFRIHAFAQKWWALCFHLSTSILQIHWGVPVNRSHRPSPIPELAAVHRNMNIQPGLGPGHLWTTDPDWISLGAVWSLPGWALRHPIPTLQNKDQLHQVTNQHIKR